MKKTLVQRFRSGILMIMVGTFLFSACTSRQTSTPTLEPSATPQKPAISIEPPESLFDQMVSIHLTGFQPNQEVLLEAKMPAGPFPAGSSQATFLTDAQGQVDLAKQAPLSGSYHTADAAGLFWSMQPDATSATPTQAGPASSSPAFPMKITYSLTASVGSQIIAKAAMVKNIGIAGMTATDVREDGLFGTLFMPPGNGPFPAVIALGGSSCGLQVESVSLMLASHGYASLALAYCARSGSLPGSQLPDRIRLIPLEYFGKAIQWLQKHPGVDPSRIAIWGDSRGAEAALLVGAYYPQIKAVISVVGYTIPQVGDPDPYSSEAASSWSYQGKGVPFVAASFSEYQAVHPFQAAVNAGQDAAALIPGLVQQMAVSPELTSAAIPVEKINGPVLFITGLDDRLVYSSLYAEFATDRLKTHHFTFPYKHLMYPGAGHDIGFFPYLVQQDHKTFWRTHEWVGGSAQADAAADEASWPQVLEFLGMMK